MFLILGYLKYVSFIMSVLLMYLQQFNQLYTSESKSSFHYASGKS